MTLESDLATLESAATKYVSLEGIAKHREDYQFPEKRALLRKLFELIKEVKPESLVADIGLSYIQRMEGNLELADVIIGRGISENPDDKHIDESYFLRSRYQHLNNYPRSDLTVAYAVDLAIQNKKDELATHKKNYKGLQTIADNRTDDGTGRVDKGVFLTDERNLINMSKMITKLQDDLGRWKQEKELLRQEEVGPCTPQTYESLVTLYLDIKKVSNFF